MVFARIMSMVVPENSQKFVMQDIDNSYNWAIGKNKYMIFLHSDLKFKCAGLFLYYKLSDAMFLLPSQLKLFSQFQNKPVLYSQWSVSKIFLQGPVGSSDPVTGCCRYWDQLVFPFLLEGPSRPNQSMSRNASSHFLYFILQ